MKTRTRMYVASGFVLAFVVVGATGAVAHWAGNGSGSGSAASGSAAAVTLGAGTPLLPTAGVSGVYGVESSRLLPSGAVTTVYGTRR